MRICTVVLLFVLLAILFLFGLFLLIPFPIALFPAIVKSQVYLRREKDGQLTTSTYYWSRLPSTQYYSFYYFNVTNPDEVLYNGERARLVELGPYVWTETEFKEDIEFLDEGNSVYYRNNKTWVFSAADSCGSCHIEDLLMLPNPAFMTVLHMQQQLSFGKVFSEAMDFLLLLLGESPLRAVTQRGVSFESYPDPLITLINSNLTKMLKFFFGNCTILPNIQAMGYFPLYNHTSDEDYLIKTGKDNTDNLALIQKWANMTHLPWWKDEYSSDITNSGDGTLQKPGLTKNDRLKQFQSFACRSFYLHYDSDTTADGIHAMTFKMNNDSYDTTTDLNKGYRYENKEMVDYFPSWPCGLSHQYTPHAEGCSQIDCALSEFWCNTCCNGTHYKDTVFMPPGVIPLRCLPGHKMLLPFAGFLSPPHFLWSPPEVRENTVGLYPDVKKHEPAVFDIQPLTGSTINEKFRMQISIPIYNSPLYTETRQLVNSFIPSFWICIQTSMREYAHDYIYFNTYVLPRTVFGVGFSLVIVSVTVFLSWIFVAIKRRTNVSYSLKINMTSNSLCP